MAKGYNETASYPTTFFHAFCTALNARTQVTFWITIGQQRIPRGVHQTFEHDTGSTHDFGTHARVPITVAMRHEQKDGGGAFQELRSNNKGKTLVNVTPGNDMPR